MSILRKRIQHRLKDIWDVFTLELYRIFTDGGVILIFFIATLLYPLIFGAIYKHECVRNLPVAVVDDAQCEESERFIHKMDATPEINVNYRCSSMPEAERLMRERRINGIVYFPDDYDTRLAKGEQARVGLFCDMSSFLYYRSILTGASSAMLDEMKTIQLDRYSGQGITGIDADEQVTPIAYDDVKLFAPAGGFTSFLLPALLVLVIHQTLFLGIGILYGTARESGNGAGLPLRLCGKSVNRVTIGRGMAYFVIYVPLVAIDLVLLPRLFGLPHIGTLLNNILFLVPFLLATIGFCMTVCSFVRNRDTGIITCMFFSVILLFLSGTVWPQGSMPAFWRLFSYLFPSTHGIQGFIRINTMGAQLSQVRFEYLALWIQTAVYFVSTCLLFRHSLSHKSTPDKYPQTKTI